jgi:GrpB-like predicted nucleotidyltransferase (UPF0157 family)
VPVEVVAYDARWPAPAGSAREELLSALPGVLVEVEHIGSTSVPGLAAKPVIDLMAAAGRGRPLRRGPSRCHSAPSRQSRLRCSRL